MTRIVNLTQHTGTPTQSEQGLIEVSAEDRSALTALLTFDSPPEAGEIDERAGAIVQIAQKYGATRAMIGGAMWLQGPLERALFCVRIEPVYGFSRRASVEESLPDGTVRKVQVFEHVGWVRPYKADFEVRPEAPAPAVEGWEVFDLPTNAWETPRPDGSLESWSHL